MELKPPVWPGSSSLQQGCPDPVLGGGDFRPTLYHPPFSSVKVASAQ